MDHHLNTLFLPHTHTHTHIYIYIYIKCSNKKHLASSVNLIILSLCVSYPYRHFITHSRANCSVECRVERGMKVCGVSQACFILCIYLVPSADVHLHMSHAYVYSLELATQLKMSLWLRQKVFRVIMVECFCGRKVMLYLFVSRRQTYIDSNIFISNSIILRWVKSFAMF